jgi:hypothetical protein
MKRRDAAPLIVIGMHRSGTTLVMSILDRLGMFIGWEVESNLEALFFSRRNEAIFNAQGAAWDNPTAIDPLLAKEDVRNRLIDALGRDVVSPSTVSFLGPRRFLRCRDLRDMGQPWGWKDPRNTFLLPLWMEVFPSARVVHVIRNGVDVANSLSRREVSRLEHVLRSNHSLTRFLREKERRPKEARSRLAWVLWKARVHSTKLSSLHKYRNFRVHRCISLDHGFELWRDYVDRGVSVVEPLGNRALTLRYEDLVTDTEDVVRALAVHARLEPDSPALSAAIGSVRPEGAFRFRRSPELSSFYSRVRSDGLMMDLGYGDL